MGVFSEVFGIGESKSGNRILLRCHRRSYLPFGDQLKVKHKNKLYGTYGCLFIGFVIFGNPNLALEYQSDVTEGHNCLLEVIIGGQLEANH